MKIRQAITVATLLLAPIGANTSAVAAEPIEVAIASPPAPTAAPSPTAVTHSADPATPPDEPRAVFDDLTTDILKVMNKWPVARIPHANYEDVASDIALVVHEFGNVWPGGEPIAQAHKSGILLAALAYWEGARFAAYVDDGRCNEWMTAAMAHPIRHMDSKTGIAVIYPNYGVLDAEAR
jgi:hypothetical protein